MVLLLEILVVAVVVLVVAAYLSGWIPGMQPAPPDRTDDGLPAGRLVPGDVDRARFGLAFRGYRMSEVDSVLDRLRDQMARYEAEIAALSSDGRGPQPGPDDEQSDVQDGADVPAARSRADRDPDA